MVSSVESSATRVAVQQVASQALYLQSFIRTTRTEGNRDVLASAANEDTSYTNQTFCSKLCDCVKALICFPSTILKYGRIAYSYLKVLYLENITFKYGISNVSNRLALASALTLLERYRDVEISSELRSAHPHLCAQYLFNLKESYQEGRLVALENEEGSSIRAEVFDSPAFQAISRILLVNILSQRLLLVRESRLDISSGRLEQLGRLDREFFCNLGASEREAFLTSILNNTPPEEESTIQLRTRADNLLRSLRHESGFQTLMLKVCHRFLEVHEVS